MVSSHGNYATGVSILLNKKQASYKFVFLFSFFEKCRFSVIIPLTMIFRVEAESLRHLSAKYCPLLPPPRSTIAAAFSPDGKVLASTQ